MLRAMRRLVPLAVVVLAGCPEARQPVMPKKPNNELIVGDFERHKPDGEQAIRFTGDGSFVMATTKRELDKVQPIAKGLYKLDGDQLTFHNERGACTESAGEKSGSYKVV